MIPSGCCVVLMICRKPPDVTEQDESKTQDKSSSISDQQSRWLLEDVCSLKGLERSLSEGKPFSLVCYGDYDVVNIFSTLAAEGLNHMSL